MGFLESKAPHVWPTWIGGKGGGKGGKFDRKGGPPSSSELPQGRREELFLGDFGNDLLRDVFEAAFFFIVC